MGSVDIILVFMLTPVASVCVATSTFEAAGSRTQSIIISSQEHAEQRNEGQFPGSSPIHVNLSLCVLDLQAKNVLRKELNEDKTTL